MKNRNDVIIKETTGRLEVKANSQAVAQTIALMSGNAEGIAIAVAYAASFEAASLTLIGLENQEVLHTGKGADTITGIASGQADASAVATATATAIAIADDTSSATAISSAAAVAEAIANITVVGIENLGKIVTGEGDDIVTGDASAVSVAKTYAETLTLAYASSGSGEAKALAEAVAFATAQASASAIGIRGGEFRLGAGDDIINAIATGDGTNIGVQDVAIYGESGNDTFILINGTGDVVGGEDNDLLILEGHFNDYNFVPLDFVYGFNIINDALDTTLRVSEVEKIHFTYDLGMTYATNEDTVLSENVLYDHNHLKGGAVSVTPQMLTTASGATVKINENGDFTYNPFLNFYGVDRFNYTLIDEHGASHETTANILVNSVNDSPTGAPTSVLPDGIEDNVYTILQHDLLAGFSDVEGDVLTATNLTISHGTLSAYDSSSDAWLFTPDHHYNGVVNLHYDVIDGKGGNLPGIDLSFNLTPVDDLPEAYDDHYVISEDAKITLSFAELLANDFDPDGDNYSIIDFDTTDILGSIVIDTIGQTLTYRATAREFDLMATGVSKTDSIKYTLQGTTGGTDIASVSFNVVGINDGGGKRNDQQGDGKGTDGLPNDSDEDDIDDDWGNDDSDNVHHPDKPINSDQQNHILGIVIGLFNAAPGGQYLAEFSNAVDAGVSVGELANILAAHSAFTNGIMGSQTTTAAKVAVLMSHYGLVADGVPGSAASQAATFFTDNIDAGTGYGAIVTQATAFLLGDSVPAAFIETANLLKSKIIAAEIYSANHSSTDLATLQAPLADMTIYTGSDGADIYTATAQGTVIAGGKGGDIITLEGGQAARDVVVLKTTTDSQISDTNRDGVITILDDLGFDKVANFKAGDESTDDRLDVTNFGFTGSQRGIVDVSDKVPTFDTDLTSIPYLFRDPAAGNRGLAFSEIPLPPEFGVSQSFVFIDANKDGDFTAADDMMIELQGAGTIPEAIFIV